MMSPIHGALEALLRLQGLVSLPMCALSVVKKTSPEASGGYIFGQGSLKDRRLYCAKANLTACEVVSVYNALIYLGRGVSFERVRSEYFRRGALTLFFLGFFGGNPYSIGRVLRSFKIKYQKTAPDKMTEDGTYIISFWNGKNDPSLHTVFCVCEQGRLMGYNIYSNDTRPRPLDIEKYKPVFIRGYRLDIDPREN